MVETSEDKTQMRPVEQPCRWPIIGSAPSSFSSLKADVPEFVPGKKKGSCLHLVVSAVCIFIIL